MHTDAGRAEVRARLSRISQMVTEQAPGRRILGLVAGVTGVGSGSADMVAMLATALLPTHAQAGAIAGWLLGLNAVGILAMAGITFISSSGVIAQPIAFHAKPDAPTPPVAPAAMPDGETSGLMSDLIVPRADDGSVHYVSAGFGIACWP